jgi:hypothetical protein
VDLEFSFYAQLRGWRIAYLPHIIVSSKLPAWLSALKQQRAHPQPANGTGWRGRLRFLPLLVILGIGL